MRYARAPGVGFSVVYRLRSLIIWGAVGLSLSSNLHSGSVRIINDAAMQALGRYKGGLLLFLGLGPVSVPPHPEGVCGADATSPGLGHRGGAPLTPFRLWRYPFWGSGIGQSERLPQFRINRAVKLRFFN